MMGEHPGDDLHRLLDGRLGAERAAEVEAHIAACARCRRELEAVRRVKSALREHLPQVVVPDDLTARVRSTSGDAAPGRRLRGTPRRVAVAAVLTLAAILVLVIARPRGGQVDVVRAVAADFITYRSGTMQLQRQTAVAEELERYFREQRVPFATPVFEFGMMGYQLTGGSVQRQDGRIRALFAYESGGGDRMICQMFDGVTSALPSATEVRDYDGVQFLVYRLDDLTLVFWQDGPVVCVLVADGDPEQAIAFARAKATRS
jgi:anti-sigma factor RsiW